MLSAAPGTSRGWRLHRNGEKEETNTRTKVETGDQDALSCRQGDAKEGDLVDKLRKPWPRASLGDSERDTVTPGKRGEAQTPIFSPCPSCPETELWKRGWLRGERRVQKRAAEYGYRKLRADCDVVPLQVRFVRERDGRCIATKIRASERNPTGPS